MNEISVWCTFDEPLESFVHEVCDCIVPVGRDAILDFMVSVVSARFQIGYDQPIGSQRSERSLVAPEQDVRVSTAGDIVASQEQHNTIPMSREQCFTKLLMFYQVRQLGTSNFKHLDLHVIPTLEYWQVRVSNQRYSIHLRSYSLILDTRGTRIPVIRFRCC